MSTRCRVCCKGLENPFLAIPLAYDYSCTSIYKLMNPLQERNTVSSHQAQTLLATSH